MSSEQSTTRNLPPRSGDLQVQQLHTFRDVYALGGYSAAASQSSLSVPTIWQHIRALERYYQTQLFEKTGRAIRPTPAADRLYQVIDEILVGLDSTFDLVQDAGDSTDAISLVTGVRMLMEDLAAPLATFRKEFDNQLIIRHGNNKRAEEFILAGEADLALSLEPGHMMSTSAIHYEPAYVVDFLAIAPKRNGFAKKNSSSLRELVKHPLIVTTQGTHGRDALEQALHREGLQASIVVETDNSAFTIACVHAGMGVGILAGRPEGPLCSKLAVRSLRKQLGRRQIVFMWRKGRYLSLIEQRLVEIINVQLQTN